MRRFRTLRRANGVPYRVGVALTRQGRAPAMMVLGLFRKDPRREAIETLYQRTAAASREPALYLDLGVPDTVEGRFEAVTLHVILVLRRLTGLPSPADEVAQEFVDCFFRHLDASLRELAVGDLAVPKRMKKLGEAFYGRAQAYDASINAGDEAGFARALGRNVIGSETPASGLARYALAADRVLKAQSFDSLLKDGPHFPEPARFAEGTP